MKTVQFISTYPCADGLLPVFLAPGSPSFAVTLKATHFVGGVYSVQGELVDLGEVLLDLGFVGAILSIPRLHPQLYF